jgi:hypothetical protein
MHLDFRYCGISFRHLLKFTDIRRSSQLNYGRLIFESS